MIHPRQPWTHLPRAMAIVATTLLAVCGPAAAVDLTSALRARIVSGASAVTERDRQDGAAIAAFYETRGGSPVWFEGDVPSGRARLLLESIEAAQDDGLRPEAYGASRLRSLMDTANTPELRAELEFRLTRGLLRYGRDMLIGRIDPARVDPEILVVRPDVDALRLLREATTAPDLASHLRALAPNREEYRRLRTALAQYRSLASTAPWPTLPEGETLKPGQIDPRVPLLRRRLAAAGEVSPDPPPAQPADLFDAELEAALRRFQLRLGIEPDGAVGRQTRLSLNVQAADRARQIEINMERWRWLPRDLGARYLMVNLAAFELALFDGGQVVHKARVVVGEPGKRTPVFSKSMTFLELNPYWNVPAKIAREEIAPKALKDPLYLQKNGYVLLSDYSDQARVVDPGGVDWAAVARGRFPYRVRQEPGDLNSLGRIKFMFPNDYDIYLHDTPSKKLFGRARRTFSHGCIRVENPFDLAEKILALSGTTDWTRAKLDEAVAQGTRRVVRLKRPMPIFMNYVTAFVTDEGEVQFRPDVYGRDRRLLDAMFPAPSPPVPSNFN